MGWALRPRIRMTKRYGHIGQSAMRPAMELLDTAEISIGSAKNPQSRSPLKLRGSTEPMKKNGCSPVVRTSPPPHTARPVSRELPVDPYRDLRWGFPCCLWSPPRTCRRHYRGRFNGACSLVYLHCPREAAPTIATRSSSLRVRSCGKKIYPIPKPSSAGFHSRGGRTD